MKRVIKFRAWSEKFKTMFYDTNVQLWNNGLELSGRVYLEPTTDLKSHQIDVEAVPLQFTGLEYKNGKDIYEGDHFGNPQFYVTFIDGCFMLGSIPLKGYLNGEYMEQVDIIKGNIYES